MDYNNYNDLRLRSTIHNANRVAEFETITKRATAKSEVINAAIRDTYNILASRLGPTLSVDVSGDTLQELHPGSFIGEVKANVSCNTPHGIKRTPVNLTIKASKLYIDAPAKFISNVKASIDRAVSSQDEQVNKTLAAIDDRIAHIKAEAAQENNIAKLMNEGSSFKEAEHKVIAEALGNLEVTAAPYSDTTVTVTDVSQYSSLADVAPIITLSALDGVPADLSVGTIIPFGGCDYQYMGLHKSSSDSTDSEGVGYDFKLVLGAKASLDNTKLHKTAADNSYDPTTDPAMFDEENIEFNKQDITKDSDQDYNITNEAPDWLEDDWKKQQEQTPAPEDSYDQQEQLTNDKSSLFKTLPTDLDTLRQAIDSNIQEDIQAGAQFIIDNIKDYGYTYEDIKPEIEKLGYSDCIPLLDQANQNSSQINNGGDNE